MAKFKEAKYFIRKNITPGSLLPDNLISFSYRSPKGVHDKSPLVLVLEARVDRIFGLNLHYDMGELDELLTNQIAKVNQTLEKEWYKKYPKKKAELKKNKQIFDVSMIEADDLPALSRRIQRRDLEQFLVTNKNFKTALRCYLYQRMTRVSKLVWKVI